MSVRAIHGAMNDVLGVPVGRDAILYGQRTRWIDWEKGPRNAKLWRPFWPFPIVDVRRDDDTE